MIIALLIAIPIGIYSGIRQDTVGDYIARSFGILCICLPSFWIGTMVIVFPSIWWGWVPSLEMIPFMKDPLGNLGMFIIPAIILGMATSGTTMRMTRTMMLEVLRKTTFVPRGRRGCESGLWSCATPSKTRSFRW